MRIELPLDINPDILIFSLPWTPNLDKAEQNNTLTKSRLNCWLTPLPTCLTPPSTVCSTARSKSVFFIYFFDDRQWQSRAELRGSLLSSGCSIWCAFDVVQAHRRHRLCLLAHDTKLRQGWNLEGRKEGNALPRQTTPKEKQQPLITQSVLIHCDIVQGFCRVVFDGKKKSRIKIKWK